MVFLGGSWNFAQVDIPHGVDFFPRKSNKGYITRKSEHSSPKGEWNNEKKKLHAINKSAHGDAF